MTPDDHARTTISVAGLDRTLFVEAGAGTGKTTQLVRRIANLVMNKGVRLANVAAITFTEAAASELRDRVRGRFERLAVEAAERGDHAEHQRALEALADTDLAAIATLHGFAQRILSENPAHSGLPPRIGVLDEVSSTIEQVERWERFVDLLFDDPANEELLVRAAALGIAVEALYTGQRTLHDVAVKLNQSWDRLEPAATHQHPPLPPVDFGPFERAADELAELKGYCLDQSDNFYITLCGLIDQTEMVGAIVDPIERLRVLANLRETWKSGRGGRTDAWSMPVREAKSRVADLAEASEEVLVNACHEVLIRLVSLIATDLLRGAETRRAEGRLEFHDLLVLASRLLKTSPEARASLHQRYTHLLLDEFQDTDPIQLELAVLIAATVEGSDLPSWDQAQVEPGRLFFVGDPKQSIYRFRRADISLFLGARQHFGSGDSLQQLTTNFRTVEPIIDWINSLFSELMAEEVPHAQPAYEPLSAARPSAPHRDQRPLVLGGPNVGTPAAEVRSIEAADVAAVVADIANHPERWPVADGEGWRPATLSDVTVLIPTRTELPAITGALADLNLAYHLATGTLIFQTQEVRDILTVLAAVDDPSDELTLVSALRSPLYACRDTDLFTYLQAGGDWDLRRDPPTLLADNHPVVEALAHMRSLWEQRWWVRPSELLCRLIDDRAVGVVAFGSPSPEESWSRLRFIVDQAMAFDEAVGGDLRAFLRWAALQGDESVTVHQPVAHDGDRATVSIMTIHGSKGLEFPIAIVAGTTAAPPPALRGVGVIFDPDSGLPGVHLKKGLSTRNFADHIDREKEMSDHEQIRLLYVALTRARDHLVVSAHHRVSHQGRVTESFGSRIWDNVQSQPDRHRRLDLDPPPGPDDDQFDPAPDLDPPFESGLSAEVEPSTALVDPDLSTLVVDPIERDEWIRARRRLLDSQRSSRTVSATGLAAVASVAARQPVVVDPGVDRISDSHGHDDDLDLHSSDEQQAGVPPRRRGRAGTAIGRATHATLQLVDLHDHSQVDAEVRRQAHLESIPELTSVVAAMVRSALASPTVSGAERYHREVYVAAPVGQRVIEGYIDLLLETDQGLVVVDYKTDHVSTEADVDAKLATYRLQGAAYAVAVEAVTKMPVVDVRFVFCRSGGAIERSVSDLSQAADQVRAACQAPVGVS